MPSQKSLMTIFAKNSSAKVAVAFKSSAFSVFLALGNKDAKPKKPHEYIRKKIPALRPRAFKSSAFSVFLALKSKDAKPKKPHEYIRKKFQR
jgi:hypothetical protein